MSNERDDGATEGTAPGPLDAERAVGAESPDHENRPTRRPRWAVGAVVAAVLVAGGGGAWWASAASGGGGDDGVRPLRMDAPVNGVAAAPSAPSDGGTDRYHLTGTLPKGPQKAAVYEASGTVTASDVQHLARLLGVPGGVRTEDGSWRAGAEAGADAPSLVVGKAAPGTWSYTSGGAPATGARTDGSGTSPVPAAKALAVAAPVLKGLGLSGAKVDASTAVGAIRTVSADPRVGGTATHGWTTSLQVGADGRIRDGFGRLADLEKGDTYPVVGAATALKELNSPTTVMHPGAVNGGVVPGGSGSVPGSGAGQSTEVRGASFGLALEYVAGVQTLVPAWLFETAPTGTAATSVVAQTAVDPRYITSGTTGDASGTPPTGTPSSPPPPNPGGPILPAPTGSSDGRTVHRVPVDSYTTSGRTLTLVYEGGQCDAYKASASASGDQVRVSVVATPKPKGTVCPMIIGQLHQTVTLAAPLGDRTVVDASNDRTLAGR
ncbi:putative membrane protein [Actinacidiphila reveromycinica]|uniref:Putative membrane protein n=1 Tax=Actinacidiphila reveromycinica TaxID=659352 RepID=A0A7U3UMB2_9ACTN|nr:hypothetical protein [Streptomyces sp. SN-593]BBA96840.1 putative membrane protein [Streptomyces sp. SN-593]